MWLLVVEQQSIGKSMLQFYLFVITNKVSIIWLGTTRLGFFGVSSTGGGCLKVTAGY